MATDPAYAVAAALGLITTATTKMTQEAHAGPPEIGEALRALEEARELLEAEGAGDRRQPQQ